MDVVGQQGAQTPGQTLFWLFLQGCVSTEINMLTRGLGVQQDFMSSITWVSLNQSVEDLITTTRLASSSQAKDNLPADILQTGAASTALLGLHRAGQIMDSGFIIA
jgi:hypothetical protein